MRSSSRPSSVGEPRHAYRGEQSLPLIIQNVHRYFLYGSIIVVAFLWLEAIRAFFPDGFGIIIGSLVLLLNVVLLSGYTFEDCEGVRANSAACGVQWGKPAAARALQGRQVVLLFEMEDADMYGYRVSPGGR